MWFTKFVKSHALHLHLLTATQHSLFSFLLKRTTANATSIRSMKNFTLDIYSQAPCLENFSSLFAYCQCFLYLIYYILLNALEKVQLHYINYILLFAHIQSILRNLFYFLLFTFNYPNHILTISVFLSHFSSFCLKSKKKYFLLLFS